MRRLMQAKGNPTPTKAGRCIFICFTGSTKTSSRVEWTPSPTQTTRERGIHSWYRSMHEDIDKRCEDGLNIPDRKWEWQL